MSRKSGITSRQKDRIQQLSRKGYSANQIQRALRKEHIGLRRTVLLRTVREVKGRSAKPSTSKYVPRKYRIIESMVTMQRRGFGTKQVTLSGTHCGRRATKQQFGSGSDLYRFVLEEMRSDFWDARPQIFS
jgi:hypothetical protein